MVIKGDIRIFPDEVKELLQGLAAEKFFADGILCGSWVMPVYRLHHKLVYALRTEDIDFAVEAAGSKAEKDLEQCVSLMPIADVAKLSAIADSQRFSKDTTAAILKSSRQIGYPPFL